MSRLPPLRATTPVENIVRPIPWETMIENSQRLHEKHGVGANLPKWVKSILGPQTRCFTGEFRYYLWERPKYTIWVANTKGIVIEVLPEITPEDAWKAYQDAIAELLPG